jgi:hypothetical protein
MAMIANMSRAGRVAAAVLCLITPAAATVQDAGAYAAIEAFLTKHGVIR